MSFLDISTEVTARDEVARMFDAERARYGYVPNFAQVFALRPGVYVAWAQLNVAIKAGMDHRRYELATLAAARRLRSSYCSLAHGAVLVDRFGEPVAAIALDRGSAGLDEV